MPLQSDSGEIGGVFWPHRADKVGTGCARFRPNESVIKFSRRTAPEASQTREWRSVRFLTAGAGGARDERS